MFPWDAIVAAGTIILWQQLKCANDQRRFEAHQRVANDMNGQEIQDALRFIYSTDSADVTMPKSKADRDTIEKVLNRIDLIGAGVRQGALRDEIVLDTEWHVILRVWFCTRLFIEREREIRLNPLYKEHLEWLVAQAQSYKRWRCPDLVLRIYRDDYESQSTIVVAEFREVELLHQEAAPNWFQERLAHAKRSLFWRKRRKIGAESQRLLVTLTRQSDTEQSRLRPASSLLEPNDSQ
jgi:hypothetical protein